MAKHNEIGVMGENIAAQWLKNKGFEIIERNFRKKWGEIDIIARPQGLPVGEASKIHFVEVKTVSYETRQDLDRAVSHGTWRPEENVHYEKQQRLSRAIQTWILENNYNGKWQIDIIAVRLVPHERYCRVKFIENIIFECLM